MPFQDLPHLVTEVAFDFQHETSNPRLWVVGLIGDKLLGVGVHATAGLAGADGAENGNAGVETSLGDRQPIGILGRNGLSRIVDLPQYQAELLTFPRLGIRW